MSRSSDSPLNDNLKGFNDAEISDHYWPRSHVMNTQDQRMRRWMRYDMLSGLSRHAI